MYDFNRIEGAKSTPVQFNFNSTRVAKTSSDISVFGTRAVASTTPVEPNGCRTQKQITADRMAAGMASFDFALMGMYEDGERDRADAENLKAMLPMGYKDATVTPSTTFMLNMLESLA